MKLHYNIIIHSYRTDFCYKKYFKKKLMIYNIFHFLLIDGITCIYCMHYAKKINEKQSSVKNVIKKDINDLSATSGRQSVNKTMVSTNITSNTTQNSTTYNQTNPPSYGYYYGGYPQNINHIDFTTNSYEHPYHDYEHINYNLPHYDKPEHFYLDSDKYHYYPVPVDSYSSSQFHQERIPGYPPGDYKKFLYTSDNIPPVYTSNDFKPLV